MTEENPARFETGIDVNETDFNATVTAAPDNQQGLLLADSSEKIKPENIVKVCL